MKNDKPKPLFLNYNLMRYSEECIKVIKYPESFEGIILSFADRYPFNRQLYNQVHGAWTQTNEYLKYEDESKNVKLLKYMNMMNVVWTAI